jgi:long-subunit acyl-CoA synthetase (AMP-forming)
MLKQIIIIILIIAISFSLYTKIYNHPYKLNSDKEYHTIIDYLKDSGKEFGEQPALRTRIQKSWNTVKYKQYLENVINFSQSIDYWIPAHTNIGIMGYNSPGWFYAHLGTMMCGRASVCVDSDILEEELKHIIKESHISLFIVEGEKQIRKLKSADVNLIVYYTPICQDDFEGMLLCSMGDFLSKRKKTKYNVKKNQKALILYQDGEKHSYTHSDIIKYAKNMTNSIILAGEKIISYSESCKLNRLISDIYLPIMTHSMVFFAPADTNLIKILKDVKPTIFVATQTIWENIYKKVKSQIGLVESKFNIIVNPKSNCQIVKQFDDMGIRLYGLMDTYQLMSICGLEWWKPNSVGKLDVRINSNGMIEQKIGKNLISTNQKGFIDADGFLFLE